jgi:hypothetical protein
LHSVHSHILVVAIVRPIHQRRMTGWQQCWPQCWMSSVGSGCGRDMAYLSDARQGMAPMIAAPRLSGGFATSSHDLVDGEIHKIETISYRFLYTTRNTVIGFTTSLHGSPPRLPPPPAPLATEELMAPSLAP